MKNSLKLLSVLFLSVLLLGLVSSANTVTFITPAPQVATVNGTQFINATLDTNTLSIYNLSYYYSTASAPTTWVLIGSRSVLANATDKYNITWVTTGFVDTDGYLLNVTAYNTSGSYITGDNITVNINKGFPTTTISSASFVDNTNVISNTSFTFGIDADNSIGISSCNLYFTNQANSTIITQSVTPVANNCSYLTSASLMSLAIDEKYNVRMEATDGNGDKTNSSSRAIKVTVASGGGGGGSSVVVKQTILGDDSGTGTGTSIGQAISNFFSGIVNFFKNLFN